VLEVEEGLCVCVCVLEIEEGICTYVNVCICTYMHICLHVHAHVCVCECVCVYIYIHTRYIYIHTCPSMAGVALSHLSYTHTLEFHPHSILVWMLPQRANWKWCRQVALFAHSSNVLVS